MKILGIDPGTATTGYGIIKNERGILQVVDYGCIRTKKTLSDAERLLEIFLDLEKIIKKHQPAIIAIESVFFYKNVKTAITVAQARGIILLASKMYCDHILEFTPLQIKRSLTSYGKAEKQQVQHMVKLLLNLKSDPQPDDAADALAVAICASHYKKTP